MLLPKIAFRNIFRQKRRSLLTGLMVAGGFVLLSVSLGFSEGTYSAIINMFTKNRTGDVQIHRRGYLDSPSLYRTINEFSQLESKLLVMPHVKSAAPRIYSPALAFIGQKTIGVRIVGLDPVREAKTTRMTKIAEKGAFITPAQDNAIVLGGGAAEVLGAKLGSQVALVGQAADGSTANDIFTVAGITSSDGNALGNMECYMTLAAASRFLCLDGRVHEIALALDDQRYSRITAAAINAALAGSDLNAAPWQEVEKEFYTAMLVDRKGNYISQLIVIIIVAIGILSVVLMSILERTREYGVMRAIGARPSHIFALVVMETCFLSTIAMVIGALLSFALNAYFSVHGITFPTPIEYGGMKFTSMVSTVSAQVFWVPALCAFVTALLVSIPAALRAARLVPVKAIYGN